MDLSSVAGSVQSHQVTLPGFMDILDTTIAAAHTHCEGSVDTNSQSSRVYAATDVHKYCNYNLTVTEACVCYTFISKIKTTSILQFRL